MVNIPLMLCKSLDSNKYVLKELYYYKSNTKTSFR